MDAVRFEGQNLTTEDQLFILMQAGLLLTATRGYSAPEVQICYEHVESLSHSLKRPLALYSALISQWRYSLTTDKLTATMQVAKRIYLLAQEENNAALMIGAYRALAVTHHYLGDFASAREYAMRGIEIWRSGAGQSHPEDLDTPVIRCLCFKALSEWHLGDRFLQRDDVGGHFASEGVE
jgi:hypothetical protein